MRAVKRPNTAHPAILDAPLRPKAPYPAQSELERTIGIHNNSDDTLKGYTYKRYKESDVKAALEALFHGKCAYCETFYQDTQPVDVEHYRPKGAVQGTEHSGYWWLASDWDNLLPSCIDCNRRRKQKLPPFDGIEGVWGDVVDASKPQSMGKKDLFPLHTPAVRAVWSARANKRAEDLKNEKRLLLDPTRDDPSKSLRFNVGQGDEFSLVYPIDAHGSNDQGVPYYDIGVASIRAYGLNRLGLVQARTRVLRDLEFLLEINVNLALIMGQAEERLNSVGITREDREFLTSMITQLAELEKRISKKFEEMMAPEAPYSTLVKSWCDQLIEQSDA